MATPASRSEESSKSSSSRKTSPPDRGAQDGTVHEDEQVDPSIRDGKPAGQGVHPVVGIGASAGGLDALQAFFDAVPVDTGVSFVVVVHLPPDQESHMADLLQGKTEMPVMQVREPVSLAPNHVYVIPPSKRLEATDHRLSVSDFEEPRGRRFPIDRFFRSLAGVEGERVGILFSGGGSDGTVGIKDIKRAGGLVLVQDPEEAEHESMPQSAIAAGLVDLVLPVREMAARLPALIRFSPELPEEASALAESEEKVVAQLLERVHFKRGHDFSDYKPSTVLSRIRRRMQLTQNETLEDYLLHLQDREEETDALFRELLAGVSKFFPDSEAFEALKKRVIPEILRGKGARDSVRAWVVGCLTGEASYSTAMLLEEALSEESLIEKRARDAGDVPKLQVFASDIDQEGLAVAREGRYPLSIELDVPEERLQRFFQKEEGLYRVDQRLRDRVVFAPHSVLRDPPFSQIDLVVCQNLAVYLQPEVQRKLFEIFHYALRPQGYLFLGLADTGEASELFREIDATHGLYQAREHTGERPLLPSFIQGISQHRSRSQGRTRSVSRSSDAKRHRQVRDAVGPASILVDEQHNAVHLSERAGRYLQHPGGPPTRQITKLVRPELQAELRAALLKAFKEDESTVARPIEIQFEGQSRVVYLTVRRAESEEEPVALVLFNEGEEVPYFSPGHSSGRRRHNP